MTDTPIAATKAAPGPACVVCRLLRPWWVRAILAVAALLVFVPAIDLGASGAFWTNGTGFLLQHDPLARGFQKVLHVGTIVVAALLILTFLVSAVRLRPILGLTARSWLFLGLAVVIGPGIVTNSILKEHWGRARPYQVTEFGGHAAFSPPLVLSNQCDRNCSFVAGDPSVGFCLEAVAYVIRRRRRAVLAGSIGIGLAIGLMRIMQGGHFLSDVLFSGLVNSLVVFGLYGVLFGWRAARAVWTGPPQDPAPAA